MKLSCDGLGHDEVMATLNAMRNNDVRWKEGRAFSLTYYAGPEPYQVALDAYCAFASENLLNSDAFPSLKRMQSDVIGTVAALLSGDDDTVGVFTSGGTESILTAVKGARSWGHTRGITTPQIVLPATAHAAFSKAADYFGVESIRVPVGEDFVANVDAMAAALSPDTVMVVASAPTYPHGVIDPIAEIGLLAQEFDILFHVDACMGFTLPWLERLGLVRKMWNFAVPGVTSMSCDLHKYAYTAKGSSVLLHRSKELRKHQFFRTNDWLGGLYGSPAILGTRGAGSLAAAWAVMNYFGESGYERVTKKAYDARVALQERITSIAGLAVRGEPETTLIAFGADPADDDPIDVYAVADHLWATGGWYCDRQSPPDSLHCTVNAVHSDYVTEFGDAVSEAVNHAKQSTRRGDRTKGYATIDG